MLDLKNKIFLRFFAVLLAAALCFGFAPVAFAMEGAEETPEIPEENIEIPEETEQEEPKVTSGSCGAKRSWRNGKLQLQRTRSVA